MTTTARILRGVDDDLGVPKESLGRILLDTISAADRSKRAILDVEVGDSYTYGDLIEYSLNLAWSLQQLGVQGDDNDSQFIAVISENSIKMAVMFLAGLYQGVPLHFINPSYTPYELDRILNISKPQVVFCTSKVAKTLQTIQDNVKFVKKLILLDDDGSLEGWHQAVFYRDLIDNNRPSAYKILEDFDPVQRTAAVFNSSGTTGLPKGVMITHEALRNIIIHHVGFDIIHTRPYDSIMIPLPFFHVFGFSYLILSLYFPYHLMVMAHFNPKIFLKSIQEHRVAELFLVPTLINFLANSPLVNDYDLTSVMGIYSGAASVDGATRTKIRQKFQNAEIYQMYGMTETCGGLFVESINNKRDGSCGRPYPKSELVVKDPKTGTLLAPNLTGEICIRWPVMKGYLNEPAKTKEVFDSEGFLHSGDIGYYDEDGFIYVVDRIKDLIKYKSFQVAPAEIEEVLAQHPAVQISAVVGKPDSRAGELPVAFVVKRPDQEVTEAELLEFVAEHLCQEKRLHGGVRFVSELPKNRVGKILRHQLRQMLH